MKMRTWQLHFRANGAAVKVKGLRGFARILSFDNARQSAVVEQEYSGRMLKQTLAYSEIVIPAYLTESKPRAKKKRTTARRYSTLTAYDRKAYAFELPWRVFSNDGRTVARFKTESAAKKAAQDYADESGEPMHYEKGVG